jgi:hypothetical protein
MEYLSGSHKLLSDLENKEKSLFDIYKIYKKLPK